MTIGVPRSNSSSTTRAPHSPELPVTNAVVSIEGDPKPGWGGGGFFDVFPQPSMISKETHYFSKLLLLLLLLHYVLRETKNSRPMQKFRCVVHGVLPVLLQDSGGYRIFTFHTGTGTVLYRYVKYPN